MKCIGWCLSFSECNMVFRLRNLCRKENVAMRSLFSVSALHVGGSTIKQLSVAMEMLKWVPSALLLSYKIFRTAVRNNNALRSALKFPNLLSNSNQLWSLSTDFRISPKYQSSWKSVKWENRWYMGIYGQTWPCQQTLLTIYANAPKFRPHCSGF